MKTLLQSLGPARKYRPDRDVESLKRLKVERHPAPCWVNVIRRLAVSSSDMKSTRRAKT